MSCLKMAVKLIGRRARKRLLFMTLTFSFLFSIYITLQSVFNKDVLIGARNKYSLLDLLPIPVFESQSEYVEEYPEGQSCRRLQLDLWDPSMKRHFSAPTPLHCDDAQHDWVYVDNGTLRMYPKVEEKVGTLKCEYRAVERVTDEAIRLGEPIRPFKNGDRILSDFFEFRCVSSKGAVYKNLHSAILPNRELIEKQRKVERPADALGLNILLVGFDSVSRLNWIRNLPKSYKFYTESLGGVVLEGYNIVGDGTPQALLPLLTGLREEELPEARRGFQNARPVDDHPWIWKQLKELGYVTQWGEDGAAFGTFNYRMKGFVDQPVDHYMRPFYLRAEEEYYAKNYAYCLGSKPRHENMLQWVAALFEAYPSLPKFSFMFHSEFSHDYFSTLSLADDSVLEFLKYMNSSGHLENTLLVMMSDHGARFAAVRNSQQGKYEERLPFFSFRLPKKFADKHPNVAENLRANAHVLTTPFDVHATFQDVIKFDQQASESPVAKGSRGISLFRRISENRTCHEANIAPHWCTCMDWIETSLSDRHVVSAAKQLVQTINEQFEQHRNACAELELDKIEAAMKFSPNELMLRFKNSMDHHGRRGDFTDNMHATAEDYQVTVVTRPGGGIFEATVRHVLDTQADRFIANVTAISRINQYGRQPHCVMEKHPHLRPYCYCKQQPDDNLLNS